MYARKKKKKKKKNAVCHDLVRVAAIQNVN